MTFNNRRYKINVVFVDILQKFFPTQRRIKIVIRRRNFVQASTGFRRRRRRRRRMLRRFMVDDDVFAAGVDFGRRRSSVVCVDGILWFQFEREKNFATPGRVLRRLAWTLEKNIVLLKKLKKLR